MGINKFKFQSFILALLLPLGSFGVAHASGFALIEMNASGQGNAYAGAAVGTNDASTIFFNPAGMMNLERDQLVVAGHFIAPSASFNNDGSSISTFYATATTPPPSALTGDGDDGGSSAFVPNLYWVKTINDKMKFGLGVNSPFGLATEYDKDWVGRYHAVRSDLKTVNINPSLAYRINDRISVGGGLNFLVGTVELTSAVDMGSVCVAGLAPTLGIDGAIGACGSGPTPAGPQQLDGFADLEGDNYDDISTGFNLGTTIEVSKQTRIGVSYRSEIEINVEGEANFTVPTSNVSLTAVIDLSLDMLGNKVFDDTDLEASVDLPASFSVSVSHQVGKITYLGDITWTGWSSFDELRIVYDNPEQPDTVTTEKWDDTMRYSFGIDYQYSDKWILRTGIALDETPVPSAEWRTPRLPGNKRTWLSFGFNYTLNQAMSLDFGYSHLFVDDGKTNNVFESDREGLNATLVGEYQADVDILSAQLNWNID